MIRKATISALSVLTLSLSTAQAATAAVSPSVQDDGVIQERIYDALDTDPMYFFRHVDVQVQHGVVTLSGYVWSVHSIYRAEKIAAGVPGVTRVVDQMELERDGLLPHA
jgi:osmotically-inducible protein OsmY